MCSERSFVALLHEPVGGDHLEPLLGGLPCTSSAADSAYVLAVLKLGGGNLLKSQEETCKVCINPYERLPHT